MFELIKKDLIVSVIGEGKSNIKYFLIMLLVYTMLNYVSYALAPILITYLFIATTFYNDYENNNIKFIESLPTSKEDIVYSKYIMSAFVLMIMIIVSLIVSISGSIFLSRPMVLNDIYMAIIISFMIQSVVLPIYFKFGYHRTRSIAGILAFIIYIVNTNITTLIAQKVYDQRHTIENGVTTVSETLFFGPFANIFEFMHKIINKIDVRYINLETITIFSLLIFLLSMYLSGKVLINNTHIKKYGN